MPITFLILFNQKLLLKENQISVYFCLFCSCHSLVHQLLNLLHQLLGKKCYRKVLVLQTEGLKDSHAVACLRPCQT